MSEINSKDELTRLGFYPNTGHHYVFLPLSTSENQIRGLARASSGIAKRCRSEREEWKVYQDRDTGEKWPWVRWRYTTQDDQPGILVAVETNIGTASRGAIYKGRHAVPPEKVETNDIPSPYFAKDAGSLPDPKKEGASKVLSIYPSAEDAQAAANDFGDEFSGMVAQPVRSSSGLDASLAETGINKSLSQPEEEKVPAPPVLRPQGPALPLQRLEIWWPDRKGEPWNVDVIVDFGNSRTVVLLLEHPGEKTDVTKPKFHDIISPVRFMKRGTNYQTRKSTGGEDDATILDTWFFLHEPMFSQFEPPHITEAETIKDPQVEYKETKRSFGRKGPLVPEVREMIRRYSSNVRRRGTLCDRRRSPSSALKTSV